MGWFGSKRREPPKALEPLPEKWQKMLTFLEARKPEWCWHNYGEFRFKCGDVEGKFTRTSEDSYETTPFAPGYAGDWDMFEGCGLDNIGTKWTLTIEVARSTELFSECVREVKAGTEDRLRAKCSGRRLRKNITILREWETKPRIVIDTVRTLWDDLAKRIPDPKLARQAAQEQRDADNRAKYGF